GFAVLFKTRVRVSCHGKGLLLHGPVIYPDAKFSGDLFSIALALFQCIKWNPGFSKLSPYCFLRRFWCQWLLQ
ncbi:MAG: hypothetical protein KKH21_10240, partial [Gammaproteobacteria bacterium]|nr:hypothetical protein [Gammaproteobacteria bacterium]